MKTTYIKAITIQDMQQWISELPAEVYRQGDKAVVTYPDGRQEVFVFLDTEQVVQDYIITPDGGYDGM